MFLTSLTLAIYHINQLSEDNKNTYPPICKEYIHNKAAFLKKTQHYNTWCLGIHSTFILKQVTMNTKEYSKSTPLGCIMLAGTREQHIKLSPFQDLP